ncbi:MAG: GtrA family protein [Rubrivivax sp.]
MPHDPPGLRAHTRALSRYAAAGALATASHYLLMGALVELGGWPAGLGALAGATLGAGVSYGLNRAWTFAGHPAPHREAMPRFLAVAGCGALLNGLLVWAGTAWLGWHWLAAQAFATLLVLLASYAANRHWTFGRNAQGPF